MWHTVEIGFGRDHPTAAGHFPGDPIIPGALLLDTVIAALAKESAGSAGAPEPTIIQAAKFLRPVRPGEVVRLQWRISDTGALHFECHLPGPNGLAAKGTIALGRLPS